ncbi:DAK2 domain-containing protein [Streptomyces sp. NRRL S-87]|uniref:DAK2 domain-containing protein n=1 Tax=Streptomyces sp. NRRL S-87 TaxID=1463920 RepID=UPI0004C07221|nr:DAK2 domain-containing protein [Streptomyces sp. NRRL S-87]
MPHVPHTLDADAVRTWSSLAVSALGRAREEIDAINVYPVADGDTGTNLLLTAEAAAGAVEEAFAAAAGAPSLQECVRAYARGALIGARGNSGTILAQLLRGMADVLAADPATPLAPLTSVAPAAPETPEAREADAARSLAAALARGAASTYEAVAHPVEGTMLTVAAAAAAATRTVGDSPAAVARAAYDAARAALAHTPEQLAVLGRAGVVDAGGCGVVAVLGALWEALSGQHPAPGPVLAPGAAAAAAAGPVVGPEPCSHEGEDGPAYEVTYLLDAPDGAVGALRDRLDGLGDSLVVVGGEGLWNVHVHVDDPGAAVEAGVEAGRPYRIRITHFGDQRARARAERVQRAVVAVVPGEGLAGLCRDAGATSVLAPAGEPPTTAALLDAVRRAHAREVVLLPGDASARGPAAAAAERARAEGVRVAVVPTRSAVQALAALAVHDPDGSFDEDVVAMTAAAGATRYGELALAERESLTSAGFCQAGDVLGLIDGDVAVIGAALPDTAEAVLARMLGSGGELVTLVLGPEVPDALADRLEAYVRERHLAVDTVVYRGGRHSAPLLIGVE